jgi:hypothetical protein
MNRTFVLLVLLASRIFLCDFRKTSMTKRLSFIRQKAARSGRLGRSKEETMKRIFTTAIIVATTATIVSLDAAAMTEKRPVRAIHQELSLGPGKKDKKPVVVAGDVTPPMIDRTVAGTQTATPSKDDYQRGFAQGPNGGTAGDKVGEAILGLMFGGSSKQSETSNKPRREAPTLKKID